MNKALFRYFLCMDCGKDTNASNEYYALRRRLWRKIQPAIAGMLCLECAERRLGRPLVSDDFTKAPINAENAQICPALAQRLCNQFLTNKE